MEKANFTRPFIWMKSLGRAALTLLALLGLVNFSYAQACNVGCNDNVHVTLKSDCSAPVTPDMLLEGYECVLLSYGETSVTASDFKIEILDEDEDDNDLNGVGEFIYEIKLKSGVQSGLHSSHPLKNWPGCWGYITGEDKTKPYVEKCPEEVDWGVTLRPVQYLNPNDIEGYGKVAINNYSCFIEDGSGGFPQDCPVPYATISFKADKTDIYTFELKFVDDHPYGPDAKGMIALFQGAFNEDEPCSNIIGQNGNIIPGLPATGPGLDDLLDFIGLVDVDVEGRLRLTLPLKEDQEYTLFVSVRGCFDLLPFLRPDYGYVLVYSDGDGEIYDQVEGDIDVIEKYPIVRRLMCTDYEHILNKDPYAAFKDLLDGKEGGYFIPFPIFDDNCDDKVSYTFEDKLVEDGDCGEIYIKRKWTIRDEAGHVVKDACIQEIEFARPNLHDVFKPAKTVPVECDEVASKEDLTPSLTGSPFIVSLFGIHDLGTYCNVGASYDDISEIEVCEDGVKIVRQWTIIDWCYVPGQDDLNNSPLINYRQIIKYADYSAPVVEDPGDKITVSTGAFDCEATFKIPGVEFEDNCSETGTVKATLHKKTLEPKYDRYGNPTGDYYEKWEDLGPVTVGSYVKLETNAWYTIKYTVTDACGNTSEKVDLDVDVEDRVAPVAVCDDDLHISVGGDGVGRLTDDELDEGSWDNCDVIDLYISRKLATEEVRDAYLDEVEHLTFEDLVATTLDDWDNDSDAVIWVEDEDGDGVWDSGETRRVLRWKDDMWYTWWHDQEWFLCVDVNTRVVLELLVVDVVLDADDLEHYGNTNVCWNDVLIEDKIRPICKVDDVYLDCTDLPYGFDPYSNDDVSALPEVTEAEAFDNCNAEIFLDTLIVVNWECNSGIIERYFYAEDDNGLRSIGSCKQTIKVDREHSYLMVFPKDPPKAVGCSEAGEGGIGEEIYGCDLLSINIKEEIFTASGDACYKIKRTYKVINWCEYDGESDAVEISRDEDDDDIAGEHDVYVLRDWDGKAYIDDDNKPKEAPLRVVYPDTDTDGPDYDEDDEIYVTGYWTYVQYVKIQDEIPPVITNTSDTLDFFSYTATCDAPVQFKFNVTDDCTTAPDKVAAFVLPNGVAADKIPVKVEGAYPDYTIGIVTKLRLPIGNHILEIHVLDGCRNSALLKIPFRVIDAKVTAPICIDGLAIELMQMEDGSGAMVVWATDFEVSAPNDDCSPPVTLSVNRIGDTPHRDSTSITLTCDDPETVLVEIYAWDSANNPYSVQPDGTVGGPNYDHCETYILVQDNMFSVCAGPGTIGVAGLITNEENETVENVQVNLTGGTARNATTTANGSFNFGNLVRGADYTVTPVKDDDYLNGVSTFDLVLITKHILGSKKLDSPYKLIAADANNSGSISAVDLIQFRKLILSVSRDLVNNTSWRFVPASYQFPDPNNPWAAEFPEILNYNDLQTAISTGDFVAIKLGDVNGSARVNSVLNGQRTVAGVFNLNVEDRQVVAGNEYRIAFTASDLNIQGYQFTLNLNGLQLIDIEHGLAKAENFGLVEDGVVTTSWNGTATSADLFTLVVRANVSASLSELLSVNSRYTTAEAYNTADEQLDVALTFDGKAVAHAGYALYQNTPNPFQGQTMIGFTLPEAAQATITIHDVTGKTLKMIRGDYAQGYNQINVNSSELPAVGVLYYTLETDEFTSTKKMIVLSE